jgi:hypothetical protein
MFVSVINPTIYYYQNLCLNLPANTNFKLTEKLDFIDFIHPIIAITAKLDLDILRHHSRLTPLNTMPLLDQRYPAEKDLLSQPKHCQRITNRRASHPHIHY